MVGLAGLLGSGRTELARLLFGLDRADRGELAHRRRSRALRSPRATPSAHGLALCPEERKTEGIVAELSVRENIALALQARLGVCRYLVARRAARAGRALRRRRWASRPPSVDTPIGLLSGGNQQKAMLARWLATEPRLLILDEPTRGIDVAAKQEIMDADPARWPQAAWRWCSSPSEMERGGARLRTASSCCATAARSASCRPAAAKHAVYALIAGHDACRRRCSA